MFYVYLPLFVVNFIFLVGIVKSETLYVKKFDNVTIYCPFKSENDTVQWSGPPNLQPYSINSRVSDKVKGIGILEEIENGEYNLIIYGFEELNEGEYQCSTVNDGKIVVKDFNVMLQNKSPKVFITGHNYSDTESIRNMECIADGNLSSNGYYKWEHLYNGEHIRYLTGYANGTLVLPSIVKREQRHEDSGSYRCWVENKVSIIDKMYAEIFIQTTGRPVFLRRNNKTHYGNYRDSIKIQFYIYSVPEVTTVKPVFLTIEKDQVNIAYGTETKRVADTFHNINVQVLAYVATFSIPVIDSGGYFTNYTIQAENKKGKSYFTFKLKENACCDVSSNIFSDHLPVYVTIGFVLFFITFASVGYVKYKTGNRKRKLEHSENRNSEQEEGNAAFNNIDDINVNRPPRVQSVASAAVEYSNSNRDEVLMTGRVASRALISQKNSLDQQVVKQEFSELNYIELDLNSVPQGCKYSIHGKDNSTEYSEINFRINGDPLKWSDSETDDDNDSDRIDCIANNI